MKRVLVYLLRAILCLIMGIMALWASAAIYYSNLPGSATRIAAVVLFFAVAAGVFWTLRPFYKAALAFGLVWAVIVIAWLCIPPSNNRNWQPDVAVLPSAQIEGDKVTVRNIRNCKYRTETDYTVSYYDQTFDLSKLQGADLFIIYWGSPMIAHTIMSFCFEDNQYLCISIETRKEAGEGYSAIKGFFKQYELIYIVGDERDLVRLRTNFRGESVYLYRLTAKPELVRQVLLDYLKSVNSLNQRPEWYNAMTQNCTTSIRGHTAPYAHGKMSWKMLVNGYLDTLLYERRAIDTSLPFEQIKAASFINDRAVQAGDSPDFSKRIREGLAQ
ncbi:MAG TPA: DUF4105 domain-containing protein [Anaerohalosphaeraceae bacterium]|nr:DUF4105 domain-containing protein [Anaerohalosphaeraceae bacterium]